MSSVKIKTKKHTLIEPIMVDGREVTELTFRRIKGKDLKDMERQPKGMEQTFFLISRLADLPPEAAEELDGEDIDAASAIIEGFMGKRR